MANEFSFQTSRGDILKSMMRRPETANLIRDALASPLGSTSRVKAKKIFSIMSKLNGGNGGMGGPGMSEGYSQMAMPETKMVEDTMASSKGMVIFHKIPKTRIVYGKKPHDASKEHNDLIKEMRSFSQGGMKKGMGGPGNDGRGAPGWVPNWVSNAASWVGNRLNLTPPKSEGGQLTYTGAQPTQVNPVTGQSAPQPTPTNISYDVNQQFSSNPSGTNNIMTSGSNAPTISSNGKVKNVTTSLDSINWAPNPNSTSVADNKGLASINWATPKPSDVYTPSIVNPGGIMSMPGINMGNQPGLFKTDLANLTYKQTEPVNLATADLSIKGDEQKDTTTQEDVEKAERDKNIEQRLAKVNTMVGQDGGECAAFSNDVTGFKMGNTLKSKTDFITTTTNPERGSVAVFGGGYDLGDGTITGHTAVVDSVNLEEGTVTLIESNVDGKGKISKRTVPIDSAIGYAVPGQVPSSDALAIRGSASSSTGTSTSGLTGDAAMAAAAVAAGVGATNFGAYMANEKKGTLSEIAAANESSIWDKYNIDEQRSDVNKMTAEGVLLPKDVTAYITARDQYIVQTDKEIANYIDNVMKNTDMSDPINASKANAQLNYLYTLRGRQNQSYIGYLNDAVEQHTAALNAKITKYNGDISVAESKLKTANDISTTEYNTMAAGFAEMYTDLKNAPKEALGMQLLEAQVSLAQAQAVTDPLKLKDQKSSLENYNALKDYMVPGINLVQEVMNFQKDQNNNIPTTDIITSYVRGIQNYMNSSEDKDATTGPGITVATKIEKAKDAIYQLKQLESYYLTPEVKKTMTPEENTASILGAIDAGKVIRKNLANQFAIQLERGGNVPKIMETVNTLAPTSIFGNPKTPPTPEQFTENMKKAVGGTLDESIARAVYATFQAYGKDSNNNTRAPKEVVDLLLSLTPTQFAQVIGQLYADQF